MKDKQTGLPGAKSIVECFEGIPDPRVERTRWHKLVDILVIGLCSQLTGGEDFTDMEVFGNAKLEWLRTFLDLPYGIPSHDTFNRVFSAIDPHCFLECFVRWVQGICPALAGDVVAIDGKALRRALKQGRFRHSASPKKLHQLRITLRKARYLAEFFGPVLGPDTARLAKRLRRVERVAAQIHDVDMAMQHLAHEGPLPPRALAIYLRQQREQNMEKLDKVWRRFAADPLHERVHHELAAMRDKSNA